MDLKAAFKVAAAAVIALPILAACSNQIIGPEAKTPDLRGDITIGEVLKGAPDGPIITIPASALQKNGAYETTGKLIIDGNIPSGTNITVKGEVVVNGNVGKGAYIHAEQPIMTHSVTTVGPGYCYGYTFGTRINGQGKLETGYAYQYGYSPTCSTTTTYNDGLIYKDADPAIDISGHLDAGVKLESYGEIQVGGAMIQPSIHHWTPGPS